MGSCLSPLLADVYMDSLETSVLENCPLDIQLWLRYVDDIYCVFRGNRDEILALFGDLNAYHPNVNFTFEEEKDGCLPFLDVNVKRGLDILTTTVYRKPTHTDQYIRADSCHPKHVKEGVVKGFVSRAHSICSSQEGLEEELNHIMKAMERNGYDRNWAKKLCFPEVTGELSLDQTVDIIINPQVLKTISIPYHPNLSEKIRRIMAPFGIRIIFCSTGTIRSFFNQNKTFR